jgi:poly [ADP-ribose] polymerase
MDSDIEEIELIPAPGAEPTETSFLNKRTPLQELTPAKTNDDNLSSIGKTPANNKMEEEFAFPTTNTKEKHRSHTADVKGHANNNILEDYNVMLNLTDIAYGVKGHNKFYQIQVQKKGGRYILFTKWGRVGAPNPQSMNEEFDSRIDAVRGFKKKFRQKTHNDWEDKASFAPKEGKYTMINIDQGAGGNSGGSLNDEVSKLNKRNELIKKRIQSNASNLDERIKSLMELIWDINKMNRTLQEMNFDTEKNPLGKLSSEQIQKGYKILTDIQNVLFSDQKQSKIIELSNQFYTNIPQNYGMKRLPPIDDIKIVQSKVKLLDVLKEIDIANRFINMALFQGKENLNPLDCFYDLLNVKFRRLNSEIDTICNIRKALIDTHGPTHNNFGMDIIDIFETERKGERERYFPFSYLPNRKLLWHGSRTTNFVGILSEGLRIAPPEAPVTGYMFGKGVYFADVASKSAQYCKATKDSPDAILLLCEVALGEMHKVYKAKSFKKPPKYYHSVVGVGKTRPDPTKILLTEDKLEMSLGDVIENSDLKNEGITSALDYNEYIVYDVGQVRVRYLLRVKCKFNA